MSILLAVSLLFSSFTLTSPFHGTLKARAQQNQLVVGLMGAPALLNPYFSSDSASGQIESLLYNGLVTFDPSFRPVPDLAERWSHSEDGRIWLFHLKRGVFFQDGVELTAKDVVYSYSIPRNKDYTGPRASDFEKIKDIKAIDRYTVEFTLKQPYAPFLSICSYAILPSHLLAQIPIAKLAEHPFTTRNPIGTGPYRLSAWKDGQYIRLDANLHYFGGKPQIPKIYFRIVPDQNAQLIQLQTGDLQLAEISPADLTAARLFVKQGKIKLITHPSLSYTYVGYNLKNPLFKDIRVRQALSYALNRELIVQVVLDGQGQVAHTHGLPMDKETESKIMKYSYNPKKAKELLAEAGWEDTDGDGILDKNGKKFSFVLLTNQGNKMREMVSQIIQEQWAKVGVQVIPRMMEWSAFINDYVDTKKFDAVLLGWSLSIDPDPTAIWHSKEIAGGLNFISYRNKQVDHLLDLNTQILDPNKRKKVILEFEKIIAKEQPYTFLYYTNQLLAVPPTLTGQEYHPAATFYRVQSWQID
jgi:peptide/nickel transport system substrate-binding protein